MPSKKSLAEQIAELDSTAPKDYDPEDILEPVDNYDANSDIDQDNDDKGRDHYVQVGKSSLRSRQFLLDDPAYAGERKSRKELYSSDEEKESWEDLGSNSESDEDAVASPQENSDQASDSDNDDEEASDSEESFSGEDSDNRDDFAMNNEENNEIKEELLKIQNEEKEMLVSMSKSTQADIEKGQHVRQQLTLWENFLESRIRMQKVVTIANQLPQHDTWPDYLAKNEGIEASLEAAKQTLRETTDDMLALWTGQMAESDVLDADKLDFDSRKRHLDDDDEYIEKLWDDIAQANKVFVPFRNTTLEKWSNKVQAASGIRLNKKFKAFDQNVMTQIDNLLADKTSLIRRTQLQRTEYQILGKSPEEKRQEGDAHLSRFDVEIFDDYDFYQQQLKELIDARMVDSNDPIAMGMRWVAQKQASGMRKKRREVDRKASKGRKLRFQVHEKIQNFMAPIPAGTWSDEKTDELYSSLLGQRKVRVE